MRMKRHPWFHVVRGWINRLFRVQVVNLDGVRIHADSGVRSRIGARVWTSLMRGGFEFEERQLLKAALRPDDRLLEIGAGLGVIGILAARLIGERNIISYEANPALEREIRANHELNGLHPKLVMKAVTSGGGSSEFHIGGEIYSSSIHERDGFLKVQVESDALNDVIAEHDPSFLVVDAEGAELQLLPNADLKNVRAVLVEFHGYLIGASGIAEIEAALGNNGFVSATRLGNNVMFERRVT